MKVKLHWIEIKQDHLPRLKAINHGLTLNGLLGSSPRQPGETVEGMIVPLGVCWLFTGNSRDSLLKFLKENSVTGSLNSKTVNV